MVYISLSDSYTYDGLCKISLNIDQENWGLFPWLPLSVYDRSSRIPIPLSYPYYLDTETHLGPPYATSMILVNQIINCAIGRVIGHLCEHSLVVFFGVTIHHQIHPNLFHRQPMISVSDVPCPTNV